MKKCPFCAEEIQDEAIKCRFCNEFLEGVKIQPNIPWYAKTSFLVLCFLTVGPLALPLVWFNSRYSLLKKAVITVIILVVTWYVGSLCLNAVKTIYDYYKQLM